MDEKDIVKIIESDEWMMKILRTVRSLDLPDWWIGAGFVRGKVWDYLHRYKTRTYLPDIDVIYFDKDNVLEAKEKVLEEQLIRVSPGVNWSVKNQARMHEFHKHAPYKNSAEGLSHWVETATCIGVRLENNGKLVLTTPHGIEDLVNLILRPTDKNQVETFEKRIKDKIWLSKWPKLRIEI